MRAGALEVADVDLRSPAPGQVLIEVLACGICGSDLHALAHAEALVEMSEMAGSSMGGLAPKVMDISRDVVMGHEFSGRGCWRSGRTSATAPRRRRSSHCRS